MGFHKLGIRAELVQAVTTLGWSVPTDVQQAVIPALLSGEDLLVSAQTGTGKSGSFLLPCCNSSMAWRARHKRRWRSSWCPRAG